jgi:hypothetical protein
MHFQTDLLAWVLLFLCRTSMQCGLTFNVGLDVFMHSNQENWHALFCPKQV